MNIDWLATLEATLQLIVVPLLVGGLGAYFGSRFAINRFKQEQSHLIAIGATQDRIQALRDSLALVPQVERGLLEGWQRQGEAPTDAIKRIDAMRETVSSAKPLFLGQVEARKGLGVLGTFIGADRAIWQQLQPQGSMLIKEAEERLEKLLKQYERELGVEASGDDDG